MIRLICLGLFSALLAGCAPATRVILLPQEGRQGAVEVQSGGSTTTLTAPYSAALVNPRQPVETEQLSAEEVDRRYRELLAAQPRRSKASPCTLKPADRS